MLRFLGSWGRLTNRINGKIRGVTQRMSKLFFIYPRLLHKDMKMKITHLICNLCVSLSLFFVIATTYATTPLWTFAPNINYPPKVSINSSQTMTVVYTVQNQSYKAKSLVIKPIPGIVQTFPCQLTPIGQAGSSCSLILAVTGNELPTEGIHAGPILCQSNSNGTPNPNQCYRPSAVDSLNITLTKPPVGVTISVNPLILLMAEHFTGVLHNGLPLLMLIL